CGAWPRTPGCASCGPARRSATSSCGPTRSGPTTPGRPACPPPTPATAPASRRSSPPPGASARRPGCCRRRPPSWWPRPPRRGGAAEARLRLLRAGTAFGDRVLGADAARADDPRAAGLPAADPGDGARVEAIVAAARRFGEQARLLLEAAAELVAEAAARGPV